MSSRDDSRRDSEDAEGERIRSQIEGLLKRAIEIGAGAYLSAEEKVNTAVRGTLNTVQIPRGVLKQLVDEFIDSYSIRINAEIKLVPKDKTDKPKESVKEGENL